jgi:hypothetical protein
VAGIPDSARRTARSHPAAEPASARSGLATALPVRIMFLIWRHA